MPEATQARQVHLWGQEGAFYGQEAYLTRNSRILLLLATMPAGVFYGQEAE